MDRPLILITTWRRRLPTFLGEQAVLETLDPAYAVGDPAEVGTVLAAADGLVITGGGDVDPVSYGIEAVEPRDGWACVDVQLGRRAA